MRPSVHALERGEPEPVTFPVSLQQQRFWLLDRFFPGNPAYNIAVRWRLTGKLDPRTAERCVNEIVRRHQVIRTRFEMRDGSLVQIIEPFLAIKMPVIDLRHFAEAERRVEEDRITVDEARRPFELTRLPLIRATLLHLSEQEHMLLVTVHHIVSDGWSIGVFVDELAALYPALADGRSSRLPELPFNYSDYALEQLSELRNGSNQQLEYWTRTLANLPRFEVPTDWTRPSVQTSNGAIASVLLRKELTDALGAFSARQGVTFFMTAYAALNAMLYLRTGREDIAVGTPVAGRSSVESESLIGVFINVLVLRCDLSADPTFLELLARGRKTVLGALANQGAPFERLVEVLKPRRNLNQSPLFSVNFIYQRAFVRNQSFGGISLTDIPSRSPGAIYDLNFFMVERLEGWRVSCEYNTDLYDSSTVERMLGQYAALLRNIASNPGMRLSELAAADKVLDVSRDTAAAVKSSLNGASPFLKRTTSRTIPESRTLLETQLASLWKEALGIDRIRVDEDFFALGANSLKAVALLTRISKLVGREVPLMTIFANPTIQELVRALESPQDCPIRNQTVAIQPLGSRPPFFFVEAEPRFLKLQKFLAPHYAPDQPILGPIANETLASARPYDLRKNASYHVDTILRVQADGPYYLGGYSAGGIMAYEIAQQLWARGREVALLVLFDTPNPHYMYEYSAVQRLKARHRARVDALRALRLSQIPGFLAGRMMARVSKAGVAVRRTAYKLHLISQIRSDDPPEDLFWVRRATARYYKPEEYPGRVLIFKGTQFLSGRYREPSYGWAALVKGGLEISAVRSDHLDLFDEQNIEPIAVELRARLFEIQREKANPARRSATSVTIG
jgi:thioesterase domain-containing protein/acyl carrier protein